MNKTFENCTLLDTVSWFKKARPIPTLQHFNAQVGVHFEEVSEMLTEMVGHNQEAEALIRRSEEVLKALAEYLKTNSDQILFQVKEGREVKFLDALLDQIVTSAGVGHMIGADVVGGLTAVNVSLFSKFVNGQPIYKPNGKIDKGPDFKEPDLTPYLPQ